MSEIDIKAEIKKAQGELQEVVGQVQQIDQQVAQLNQKKTPLVQQAIELQGAIKRLESLNSRGNEKASAEAVAKTKGG